MKSPSLEFWQPKQGSLHYTPEHCLVDGGFPLFWWKKTCFNWAKCIFQGALPKISGERRTQRNSSEPVRATLWGDVFMGNIGRSSSRSSKSLSRTTRQHPQLFSDPGQKREPFLGKPFLVLPRASHFGTGFLSHSHFTWFSLEDVWPLCQVVLKETHGKPKRHQWDSNAAWIETSEFPTSGEKEKPFCSSLTFLEY